MTEEIPVPALEQIFIKEEFIEEEFIKEKLVKKELIKEEFVKGESITEDLVKEKLINEKFVKGKFIKEESLKKEFMKKEFTHANNETLHDSPITPAPSDMMFFCPNCKVTVPKNKVTKNKNTPCPDCQTPLRYQCRKCSRTYRTWHTLHSHIRYQCKIKPYLFCDLCSYKTNLKGSLVFHMTRVHCEENFRKCSKCGEKYVQRSNQPNHERYCGRTLFYKCKLCEYTTAKEKNLNSHVQKTHDRQDQFQPYCPACHKRFKVFRSFKVHVIRCLRKHNKVEN